MRLVSSYPADGEIGVPLDATLRLITSNALDSSWHATLNDHPLRANTAGAFAPGILEADTEYRFRLEGEESDGSALTVELYFLMPS